MFTLVLRKVKEDNRLSLTQIRKLIKQQLKSIIVTIQLVDNKEQAILDSSINLIKKIK